MGLQFVQLRCRSATRWPTDARLDAIADDASKPGKRHRHCAKRRRYAMAPPVLQMAFSAAGRAARPLQPVAVGLRRNDRSLNTRQKPLRFGQGQSQVSNIAKTFRPADLYRSVLRQRASPSVAINRNTHRIPVPPVGYRPDRPYPLCRHTPIRWTLPMQRSQSDDIAWYASHGSGRVIRNLPSNAAVWAYSCTKARHSGRASHCCTGFA